MDATTIQPPAKIQKLLDHAAQLGLTVEFNDCGSGGWGRYTWAISSGKDYDRDRIWIYWSGPGANGGRTGIRLYRPYARRKPSRVTKQTVAGACSWMRVLAS
jgi:hypothetical protein